MSAPVATEIEHTTNPTLNGGNGVEPLPPFEELMRRYAGLVYSTCYRITHDVHDAEDATQAVFLTLAVEIKTGAPIRHIAAWLQQVARRLALNLRRGRNRRKKRELIHGELARDRARDCAEQTRPERGLEETKQIVAEEMEKLPPRYRMPLILHYFGGLDRQELASELSCRPATLRVRLHRARTLLVERLKKRGVDVMPMAIDAAMEQIIRSAVTEAFVSSATRAAAGVQAMPRGLEIARGLATAKVKATIGATFIVATALAAAGRQTIEKFAAELNLPNLREDVDSLLHWFNPHSIIPAPPRLQAMPAPPPVLPASPQLPPPYPTLATAAVAANSRPASIVPPVTRAAPINVPLQPSVASPAIPPLPRPVLASNDLPPPVLHQTGQSDPAPLFPVRHTVAGNAPLVQVAQLASSAVTPTETPAIAVAPTEPIPDPTGPPVSEGMSASGGSFFAGSSVAAYGPLPEYSTPGVSASDNALDSVETYIEYHKAGAAIGPPSGTGHYTKTIDVPPGQTVVEGPVTPGGNQGANDLKTTPSGGTLILVGANNYNATYILGGTLQVGYGGATGTLGSGQVYDNGNLAFDLGTTYTFTQAISGSGAVTQIGKGTTTLSAVSTYTGGTTITSGDLAVTGSLNPSSWVTVKGGTLSGFTAAGHSVGNVDLISGSVSPGTPQASIGDLNITSLTAEGGVLSYDLATSSVSDLLKVSGLADFKGTVEIAVSTGVPGRYVLLTAADLAGTVPHLVTPYPSAYSYGLSFDTYANDIVLTVQPASSNSVAIAGGSQGVPEPASATVLAATAAGLMARRRRRQPPIR